MPGTANSLFAINFSVDFAPDLRSGGFTRPILRPRLHIGYSTFVSVSGFVADRGLRRACRARSAQGLLGTLFEYLPDPVYVVDPPSARIVFCNRAGRDHFGLERDELVQRTVLNLHTDLSDHGQWQRVAGEIRRQGSYVYIGRHRHHSGRHVPVEVHSRTFSHLGREYFLSVARRVGVEPTELGRSDILDRDAQVRFALNDAIDGLWDWDLRTGAIYFSPHWRQMLGFAAGDRPPTVRDWLRSIHPDDRRRVSATLGELTRGPCEHFETEYRLRSRDGHYLWVQDRGKASERDAVGRPMRIVGMTHDITERKLAELELQRKATHDGLTGLLNRHESELVLATQLQLCRRLGFSLSVCLFDIDHFKRINDRLGHLTGDLVLQRVAELVGAAVRASDFLFRWGGEEFLLVCTDTGREAMSLLADKLRQRLEAADWPNVPGLVRITASFGVASFPDHPSVRDLLSAADGALYRAKRNGRNRVASAPRTRGAIGRRAGDG